MNRPKVIVFDLGKVLVDFDYGIAADKIAAKSKLNATEVRKFIDHSPLLFRYETGLMTRNQFYNELCSATGYSGDIEAFQKTFGNIFTPIEPMLRLHAAIRAKNIPTFIFSNTNDIAIAHIRSEYPFFSLFDGYILSYEHGAMKPNARLYEVVEKMTGQKGSDILYLDDRPENVAAGSDRGWQVILQESAEKTSKALLDLKIIEAIPE